VRLITCMAVANLSFSLSSVLTGGVLFRFEDWQAKFLDADRTENGNFGKYVTEGYTRNANRRRYTAGDIKPKVFLLGDSFSQDFFNVLREGNLLSDVELIAYYLPAICANVPAHVDVPAVDRNGSEACTSAKRVGDAEIDRKIVESDGVIVASAWTDFTAKYINGLQQDIYRLGIRNVLIVGRKTLPTLNGGELMRSSLDHLKVLTKEVVDPVANGMRAQKLDHYLVGHPGPTVRSGKQVSRRHADWLFDKLRRLAPDARRRAVFG
jgi:hypothetical protein